MQKAFHKVSIIITSIQINLVELYATLFKELSLSEGLPAISSFCTCAVGHGQCWDNLCETFFGDTINIISLSLSFFQGKRQGSFSRKVVSNAYHMLEANF